VAGSAVLLFFHFLPGALWHDGQMSAILMAQHAQTLYESPNSLLSQVHAFLISHPGAAQCCLWSGFLIQLSFIGGFFTQRFDRIYLILFILFFAINYLIMDIVSIELFVFCLVLIDWDKKLQYGPQPVA
jgi:hypothetical protein